MYKSYCRNCPHHRDGHVEIYHSHIITNYLVRQACYGNQYETPALCKCLEYAPKDNLEYLEWKYNKKDILC